MGTSVTRDLDGNDRLDTGSNDFDFTTQDFTVGIWINGDAFSGQDTMIAAGDWSFKMNGAHLGFTKFGIVDMKTSTMAPSINTWYFMAAVIDISANVIFYRITETGVTITETETNGTNIGGAARDLNIGARDDGSEYFDGQLAHAQIWNRLLSSSEIQEAAHKPGSIKNGLLAYWPVWGVSSSEIDLGGSGYTATLSGTNTSTFDHPSGIVTKGS